MHANSSQRRVHTPICIAVVLGALLGVVAVAGAASLAGPAQARNREADDTRAATSLTLTAAPLVVEYGGSALVAGDLTAAGAAVAGASLIISSSTDGLSWADLAGAATDEDGHFSLSVTPVAAEGRTVFRATYQGSDTLLPCAAQVSVGSRAALTAPPAPQTVGRGSRFAVSGLLQPRHPAGTAAVTICCYRRESGAWVLRRSVPAGVADQPDQPDASLYSAIVSLPLAGKWRLQAYHADDAHADTQSAFSPIVVVTTRADAPIWNRDGVTTLPERMKWRRSSRQLVVVTAARLGSRDGTVRLFDYRDGDWVKARAFTSRLGRRGLIDGLLRHAGSLTTPTGIWRLPGYVFGTHRRPPDGTRMAYRQITQHSWWSSERNATYNTWVETSRWVYGEHLADYPVEYEFAFSSGYNAPPNSRISGRGAGIFVHVFGRGYTAGCVSVARGDMIRLLRWLDPAARPACAIGTRRTGTRTCIYAY
jgi:L,D-peptidoglycan transpeptidase YkuD (ErfK/YbiS/YcfS/YnhG family)